MTTYTQGGIFRSFKADGTPNSSGFVYTYAAGTLTPLATYVTPGGSANTNPVALGTDGTATICLTDAVAYRLIEKTAGGATIKDTDNVASTGANLQADLASTASGKGSKLVAFIQRMTGAVSRWVEDKLAEEVSVLDFGADPTGVADSTTAFTNAGKRKRVPAGVYKLTNYRVQQGEVWLTDGPANTIITQGSTSQPAINCLSDATAGQLSGISLTGFTVRGAGAKIVGSASGTTLTVSQVLYGAVVIGAKVITYSNGGVYVNTITGGSGTSWTLNSSQTIPGGSVIYCVTATVAAVSVAAYGAYAVWKSEFKFVGEGTWRALDVQGLDANNVFYCDFQVTSENHIDTAVNMNGGVYNKFDMFLTNCYSGQSLSMFQNSPVGVRVVSDGFQYYSGYDGQYNCQVEGWTGPPQLFGIQNAGSNNTFLNPTIVSVPRGKITAGGLALNSTPATIINMNLGSTGVAFTFTGAPSAATSGTLSSAFTADVTGQYYVTFTQSITFTAALAAATSGTLTSNWTSATGIEKVLFADGTTVQCSFTNGSTAVTWFGPITATAAGSVVSIRRACNFTNGATTCNWAGAVTASATAIVAVNCPAIPVSVPYGSSATFIDAKCADCQLKLENVFPNNLAYLTFLGDCSGLTDKGGYWKDSGTATFAAATTVAVSLPKFYPSAAYKVSLAPQANKTFWVTNKTQAGFTLNASSASSDVVDWSVTT